MLRKILAVVCIALASVVSAETHVGIAYRPGSEGVRTNRGFMLLSFWVAGTDAGPLLGNFSYTSQPADDLVATTLFVATRIRSFTGYHMPIFGKVVDIWLEGLHGAYNMPGRPVVAHFRMSDPGENSGEFAFFTMDIYLPGDLSKSVLSEYGVAFPSTRVLIADDAGLQAGGQWGSNTGLAYTNGTYVVSVSHSEIAATQYRVFSNGILDFLYEDKHIGFIGKRLKSFQCANKTFFGRAAEFWMDGCIGPNTKTAHTPVVARVFVTDSSEVPGLEFLLISIFDPIDLTKPVYQQFGVRTKGDNRILCK